MSLTKSVERLILEEAAQACGYTLRSKINAERMLLDPIVTSLVIHMDNELVATGWNPFEYDECCARMEATLKLNVSWFEDCVLVEKDNMSAIEYYSHHKNDRQKARRAASTILASSIWRWSDE